MMKNKEKYWPNILDAIARGDGEDLTCQILMREVVGKGCGETCTDCMICDGRFEEWMEEEAKELMTMNHEKNAQEIIQRELKKDLMEGSTVFPLWKHQSNGAWNGIFLISSTPILYEISYYGNTEKYYGGRYQRYGGGIYSLDELEKQE